MEETETQIQQSEALEQKKKLPKKAWLLILLCWLVYTSSLIGKYGYDATNVAIKSAFGVDKVQIGLVSSCFFFAYGCGQIVHGILCKKYHMKYVVAGALIMSAVFNLIIGVVDCFPLYKYIWLVNGIASSVLWCSVMRVLAENLNKTALKTAVLVMSTTVALGTAITYGLSFLFVTYLNYKWSFLTAAILLPVVAAIWFFSFDSLTKDRPVESAPETAIKSEATIKRKPEKTLIITIVILAVFAAATNLIRQGLTTWVPTILKETFALPDNISIILTLLLPIGAIFGTVAAVFMQKKISDYVVLCGVLFFISAGFMGVVVGCMTAVHYIVTLICFAIVSCMMAGVNNVITSMAPLYMRDRVNTGRLAGILNGCCYVGSTISSFGLGKIAEQSGWNAVFILLLCVAVATVVITAVYGALIIIKKRKNIEENGAAK